MPITQELLKKVKRKFLQIAERNIPYHLSYRPHGLYLTSKEYINAVAGKAPQSKYIEIYPNLVTNLTIDEEIYEAIIEALKPKLQVKTDYIVTAVENGRVFTDHYSTIAIISGDDKLIADISFSYNNAKVVRPQENAVFSQKFFRKPVKYKGVVFCMLSGQGAVTNYGHWLMDSIPRLHLLKKSGLYDKVNWFIVPNYQYDFHKDILTFLGIDASKIIKGNQQLHIQADVVIGSSAPRGNDSILPFWVPDFLRGAFLNERTLQSNYSPLVYISRRDSDIRRVINEEEVTNLLSTYGFKTYVLKELPFVEKVKLFASANVIISTTGAGMMNVVFCKKGAKIIEIFGKGFVNHDTIDIANKLGVEHHYIISQYGKGAKDSYEGQHQHVTVDLDVLKRMVENILQDQKQNQNSLQ